jgi:hypothetical protein
MDEGAETNALNDPVTFDLDSLHRHEVMVPVLERNGKRMATLSDCRFRGGIYSATSPLLNTAVNNRFPAITQVAVGSSNREAACARIKVG